MHTLRLLWAARNEEVWLRRQMRNKNRRSLENIHEMPDLLFIERFRLNKPTFWKLCDDLRSHTSLRGTTEISVEVKVLCTLSFLATGSYQRVIGVTQHLQQRTTSRCIREVVNALNEDSIIGRWIVFPQSAQERLFIKQEFQRKFNLPGVIGCIDCSHIAIVKPNDNEHVYFNRKGYHSINVQMVCDSTLEIRNVNAKFGGSTHDSFIWGSSKVEPYMRRLHQSGEQVWLLGDSGYPQRPWLMTPVLNAAAGSQEDIYTRRHVQARNCIERVFGVLKSRWRCLLKDRVLHYHPHVAGKIIQACCVLHNIALKARLPEPIIQACCVLHNIALKARLPEPIPIPATEDDNNVFEQEVSISTSSQSELIQGRAALNCLINRLN